MKIKTIGVMGAIPEETAKIVQALCKPRVEHYAGADYHMGHRGRRRLVVCCGGGGKGNAAATAQALISHFGVDALVFTGIAGNMSTEIGVGDMVVGREVCYHDTDPETPGLNVLYSADPLLVDAMAEGCRLTDTRYLVGRVATGDQFVGNPETKRKIKEKWRPHCVEMEGAAMGHVAARNGVPFVVLRAMSDNSEATAAELGGDDFDLEPFVTASAAATLAGIDALESLDI